MLKSMRSKRNALKWTLVLVILAFVGFIFIEWGMGRTGKELADTTILKVNNQQFSQQEFIRLFRQLYRNYRQQYKEKFNMTLAIQMNLAETILQEMVNRAIIEKEASRLGLVVTDDELAETIQKLPYFQRDGKFIGAEEYKNFILQMGIKIADFEGDTRYYLLAEKLKEYVTAGAIISKDKLWNEYQQENDRAELKYVQFKISEYKEPINIENEELINYYEQNKNNFKSPEKRKGYYLIMKIEDLKKDIRLSDEEIFRYFNKNKNFFRDPAKVRVWRIARKYNEQNRQEVLKEMESIRPELNKDNFAEYARKYSEDEKASQGGDWGYYEWQNFSSVEQGVIEKAKEGDISYVIDNGSELLILFIAEKKAEAQKSFEEVKEQIKNFLLADRARQEASKRIEKLYKKIEKSLDIKSDLVEEKIKVHETSFLTNGESIKEVDQSGAISQKLFSLKENEVSAPIEMFEGFAIVQLKMIQKPEILPFEKVKEEVRQKVEKEKKLDELTKRSLKIIDQLKNMKEDEQESYLKKENLSWQSIEYRRGNKLGSFEEYPELDRIIFSLNESEFAPILKFSEDVLIVKLKSKSVKSKADFENDFTSYYMKKSGELKNELFNIYLQDKSKNYKIRLNEKLFFELKENLMKRGDI